MNLGENINVAPQELLTGRTCILAQSGGGKSYGVGVICEELCRQKLGFAIIDTEGEYSSLKQKFDVLWVGMSKRCDLNISEVSFEDVAYRAISNNIAVVFDVSEVMDLVGVVDEICSALYKKASELRMPYLLIIEEADKFAPQKGGKVVGSLNEVARRGRKRGLGLMVASQRPAFVNKDILSQCNNQFIGRLTIQNDLNAVKQFFNERDDLLKLPDLKYHFFAMGEFVNGQDTLFKFKKRITKHGGLTPSIKPRRTKDVAEFIRELKEKPMIKREVIIPKISKEKAKLIVNKKLKKRFGLFGELTEGVLGASLQCIPVIEAVVELKNKKMFRKSELKNYKILFDTVSGKVIRYDYNEFENTGLLIDLDYNTYSILRILKEREMTEYEIKDKLRLKSVDTPLKKLKEKNLIAVKKRGRFNEYSSHFKDRFYKLKDFDVKVDYPTETINADEVVKSQYKISHLKKIINSLESDVIIKSDRIIYYPFYIFSIKSLKNDFGRKIRINGITGKIM